MLLLSTIGLGLFIILSSTIGELSHKGSDSILLNALLKVPFSVYDMMPLACVIGIVIGVQSLINNNELSIIKGIGLTGAKITSLVALPAFILGIASLAWIDFVAVPLHKQATAKLSSSDQTSQVSNLWLSPRKAETGRMSDKDLAAEQEDSIIYVNRLYSPDSQESDNRAEPPENNRKIYADNLVIFDFLAGDLIGYSKGSGVKFVAGALENQVQADRLISWSAFTEDKLIVRKDQAYQLNLNVNHLIDYPQDRRSQNVYQLWRGEITNKHLGLPNAINLYEIWGRISTPLLFVSLALLMLAFCLAIPPRSSMILQVIISIAIGLLIGTLFRSLAFYVAATDASYIWLGSLGPPAVLAGISYYHIRRYV